MALTAAGWSERNLERRFDIGAPGHELTLLAATLNGLLDKVSEALGAEQRLTAELAHELRSPLAAAQTLTELMSGRPGLDASMREDISQLRAACLRMGETITTLLGLARHGPLAEGDGTALSVVIEFVLAGVPRGSEVSAPEGEVLMPFQVAGERDLLVRTLAPLVDNALRNAHRVRISAEPDPSSGAAVLVHVDDDGPGVASEVEVTMFRPGVSTNAGPGLGLPLARRVARSLGGDVFLATAPPGWSTRFTVRLERV
jgi:signal transduction histidine kinase